MIVDAFAGLEGQGWPQVGNLALALVLSAVIGVEREARQKSAGLRTHSLVGFASALFVLISQYGFGDSRLAAQVVSGIGFIGAGLIFVRRDGVKGLTTAAAIWMTCAVGMAAGAGLWLLALVVTAGHILVVYGFTAVSSRLPRSKYAPSRLHLTYVDGQGVLRAVLEETTRREFAVAELSIDHKGTSEASQGEPLPFVTLWLTVTGSGSITELTASLSEVAGVLTVSADDGNAPSV
jgi:putative Mg2+ transporter-C (MgtC) family protein